MKTRFKLYDADPEAWKAMINWEKYFEGTEITKAHRELIKIRASQINGCAFCLNMHTKDARKNGETEQRIYTLSAWRDTTFFTDEEKAILAMTEAVTDITRNHVPDAVYENAVNLLGEKYTAQVLMAIISINAWNRIAITTGLMPE